MCALVVSLFGRQRKLSKKLKSLRNAWGKIRTNPSDIESAKIFFELNKLDSIVPSYCLDEATWHDLDFDEITSLIDRTTTPVGAQHLFYLLRHPVLKKEILEDREELINHCEALVSIASRHRPSVHFGRDVSGHEFS